MDLTVFPLILQQKIYCYVDPFSLLSAVQTCLSWRDFLTSESFLENYCQARLGISFSDLLDLERWERLLVETQRIMFQKTLQLEIDEADLSLMKIHMLHYRLLWAGRKIISPLNRSNYLAANEVVNLYKLDEWMPGLKRMLTRLLAAIPIDVFLLQHFSAYSTSFYAIKLTNVGDLGYDRYDIGTDDQDMDHIGAFLGIRTSEGDQGPTLKFVIYDDGSWRPIYQGSTLPIRNPPIPGQRIPHEASIQEIRHMANPTIRLLYDWIQAHPDVDFPYLALFLTPQQINPFQIAQTDFSARLGKTIESAATEIADNLGKVTRKCTWQVIEYLESSFPCMALDHGMECAKRHPSPIVRVALIRALRRMINSIYLPEVQELYDCDQDTSRLIYNFAFPSNRKGQPYTMNRCRGKHMKKIVRNACCHQAHPDLWPVVVTVKAIHGVSMLASELDDEVTTFVRNRCRMRSSDKYMYSLGYSLRMLEKWSADNQCGQ